MSQRVQKGSTVFRPVARPRPRPGTESRQSSAFPETTQAATGPSRLQESVKSTPVMPASSSIPQRPQSHIEPVTRTSTVPRSTPEGGEVEMVPRPFHPSSSGLPSIAPPVRTMALRMPPMVGSSQQEPHSSAPSHPTNLYPHPNISMPLPSIVEMPAQIVAGLPHGEANIFNGLHAVPPHHPDFNSHFPTLPFHIDPSQIDPRLIDPSSVFGLPPIDPQGVPLHGSSVDDIHQKTGQPHQSVGRSVPDTDGLDHGERNINPRSVNPVSAPVRRRSSKKTSIEADENASDPTAKRSRMTGSRRSRTRPPSPPPFDYDADPGEELDPTVVTMATLCDDTGRGRVSSRAAQIVSNHAAWRTANREKRARMKAVLEAKKYGRNLEEEEEAATQKEKTDVHPEPTVSDTEEPATSLTTSIVDDDAAQKEADGFDYSENLAVSRYNVQVRIGANGETIIDEDSLFVNRDEEHRTDDYTHVEESDFTKFVNSATYSRKVRGSRWSAEETELFYDALSQFGENYELISYVLPGRNRKACKNKFKAEDKKNPARITHCLNNRRPYDIATLSRMTGKDFSGPTPEIRAPTPIRSTELQTPTEQTAAEPSKPVRKKSKTPVVRDLDVEIIGDIDDVDQDD
ncbi:hypothetical protein C8Q80DRAFT_1130824 [Daedaleopsis nitida]|nr:hypothetical protein C8Q80DRAFT_1130824 [Daedaleopsis nitida]